MGIKLTHSNMRQLSEHLRALGWPGKIIGMALVFFQTFFPFIPFVIVAGTNVAIFGIKVGFLVNYVMSCLGAIASFYFARYYGHAWVEKKLERFPLVKQFSTRMEKQGFLYVFLGRLIPILPSSAINFAAGLTRMRFTHFLWGTLLGKLPIIYLESMIAHDLFHFRQYKGRLLMLLAIFVGLMLIGNVVKKVLTSKSK
ncbi:TVP38/TMEM64 family protein [Paenibacillus sp. N3.4]|nr:TVP38/TMEM64 family protein [Paenibacillus sp. N3.4]